jgi:hypothetical protein
MAFGGGVVDGDEQAAAFEQREVSLPRFQGQARGLAACAPEARVGLAEVLADRAGAEPGGDGAPAP